MATDAQLELVRAFAATVKSIGFDALATLMESAPDHARAGIEPALLEKFVGILKQLAEEEAPVAPASQLDDGHGELSGGDDGGADPPYYSEAYYSDHDEVDGYDEVDDYSEVDSHAVDDYSEVDSHGLDDHNVNGHGVDGHEVEEAKSTIEDDEPPIYDEVKISDTAFPELFPTKEFTKKEPLPKSFPNIDEFDGGVHFLGQGNFGYTFKSILRRVPVVLKVSKIRSEESNRADYHEWSVSEKLKPHANVLQITGLCPSFATSMFFGVGTTALIAPLQENGGLRQFFDKRVPREGDIMDIAFGMIAGVRSLHEQRAIHRDIAVRNFLVDCDGRVLLCDFGLTEFVPDGKDSFVSTVRESLPWQSLAPESFDRVFSRKTDIWMYGVTLYELISNRKPWPQFRRARNLEKALRTRDIALPDMKDFPPVIAAVVRDCLQFDAAHRPSADDIAERLVKSLLEDVDERDENGNTSLHRIALNGWTMGDVLSKSRPWLVNATNFRGETPLMMVKSDADRRSLLAYQKVPPCNPEPSRIPEYFHNIDVFGTLLRLTKKEDVEGVKLLGRFKLRDSISKQHDQANALNGETSLHVAARSGNAALLNALLSLNVFDECKPNSDGQTALHVAAIHGHAAIIEALMDATEHNETREGSSSTRSFVNAQDRLGKTALHLAAQNDNVSATDLLLRNASIDVNVRDLNGRAPVFDSIARASSDDGAHLAVLKSFLNQETVNLRQADFDGETLLHKIVRKDAPQAARMVLESAGFLLSAKERERGYTPLHLAIRELSSSVVEVLLSRNEVDINEEDKYGNTSFLILIKLSALSLFTAHQTDSQCKRGAEIARMLLACPNVNINKARGSYKTTYLQDAVEYNNKVVVKELLAHPEVDVNCGGLLQVNPLHHASKRSLIEIVKLLLARGDVDVNARDKLYLTPLHYVAHHATRYGSVEIANALLAHDNIDVNARDMRRQAPLHYTALFGSPEVAKLLLKRDDVDANARDGNNETPLHYAARYGSVEVANILLARDGVDANARDEHRATPLHYAASGGSVEVAKLLLARMGIDANARDEIGRTPLHFAAYNGSVDVARLLLVSGVDADARDDNNETPLHRAAQGGSVEVAKMLLTRDDVDAGARDRNNGTPLHNAAQGGSVEVAKLLLARDDVDANARVKIGRTPLHYAAYHGSVEVARLLLMSGVDDNAQDDNNETPLHHAVFGGSVEVAKLLLARDDIDVNARDEHRVTPLHYAARYGSVDVAKLLLARLDIDANARDKDRTAPLHHAARYGSVGVAKLLLARGGIDANVRDANGRTPLHYAAYNSNVEVARLLLMSGVDADARDAKNKTPLHHAAHAGSVEVARLLLIKDDVDAAARDDNNQTPLHHAAHAGSVEVAKLLLARDDMDVDVNAQEVDGRTSLAVAATARTTEVVEVLLSTASVDANTRDVKQRTPLHHAASANNHEVARMLLATDDVDAAARDVNGKTPLDLAEEAEAAECVQLLAED